MASSNPNANRTLAAYAISSNSILEKIEELSTTSSKTLSSIETIVQTNVSTMRGISAAISENTKVLKEIKAVLSSREDSKSALAGGINMKTILGAAGLIAVAGFGVFTLATAFSMAKDIGVKDIIKGVAIIASLIPMAKVLLMDIKLSNIVAGAGLVALAAGGLIALSYAYQIAGVLKRNDIVKGLAVVATLVPMVKVFSSLMAEGGSIFGSISTVRNLALVIAAIAGTTAMMALTLSNFPSVTSNQMLGMLAVSAVIYIQGKIFIGLIKAWEFSGFINKYLNKNNTSEIMGALFVMTLNTVIIAGAMNLIPSISKEDAFSFVIATTALIPMAAALVVVRFALPALRGLNKVDIIKFGGMVLVMSAAMIPIALAAKMIGKISISEQELKTMNQLIKIMLPIGIIVSFMSAIINLKKQSMANKSGMPGTSLLKQDNSRKRKADLRPREIKQFAIMGVLILVALGALAMITAWALPKMAPAISAMSAVDFTGLLKFILLVGLATLLMGSAIAMVMKAMKGGGSSSTNSGMMGFGAKRKTKAGAITSKDILAASLIIPMIIVGIAMAALAWAIMPDKFPEIKDPGGFLLFTLLAGIAVNIFGAALGRVASGMRKMSIKQMGLMSLAIPIVAIGILATAWIFKLLPDVFRSPDISWSLKIALPLVVMGAVVYLASKTIGKIKTKKMTKTLKNLAIVAAAVFIISWIFNMLPDMGAIQAPGIEWTGKAALSLLVFSGLFFLAQKLKMHKTKSKNQLKILLLIVAAAVAILIVAHIFTLLPAKMTFGITVKEALAMAATLGAMGAAMVAMGKAVKTVGPVAIGYGLLGIIAAAIALLIAGWILSALEHAMPGLKVVAAGFVDIIMNPMHKTIDIFKRFKDEIGVDNMLPMALGIAALGGGLIIFGLGVAALGGGGFIAGLANVGGAVLDWMSSKVRGKAQDTSAMGVLKSLIFHKDDITDVSKSLDTMSMAVKSFPVTARGAIEVLSGIGYLLGMSSGSFRQNAKSFDNVALSYGKIAKASKQIDVKVVTATTNMFKALNELVYNGPDSTLKIFAEQLMVAVKELSDAVLALEEVNANSSSSIGDAISGVIGKASEVVFGKAEEVKKRTDEAAAEKGKEEKLDLSPLILAIENLQARFDMSIKTVDVTPVGLVR